MIKKIGIGLIVIIVLFAIVFWIADKPKPEGVVGPEADALARKMELAMNKAAWDTTKVVQWTFKGLHTFIWDKENNQVNVKWDGTEVVVDPNTREGRVLQNPSNADEAELLTKAYAYFANDSFWLYAHYKAFDPGTTRAIVKTDEGDALLVFYSSGGVTPGDSYLWYLDEEGKPYKWEMWVQMLPLGGLSFTWDKWTELYSGAMVPAEHKGLITIDLTDIKSAESFLEL